MILDIEPLPYKIGVNAEEHEGSVRINLTLYDQKQAILKEANKKAILEEDYMDVKPDIHQLNDVVKQAIVLCNVLIGRQIGMHSWIEHRSVVAIRINDIFKSTIMEEKLLEKRLLSKFYDNQQ